jgi:glycosyltransferase involved in cell wall biosynthesis
VLVARPGADPAPPTAPSESGNRLLCVAALTLPKGADVLVDALARLAGLPWTCTWVGRLDLDPALVTTVSTRARAGGIGARLRLTGPLDRTALASAYAAADLLVLPSRLETYGMVVTEALAAGVPVVATDVGGVPEAFGRDDAGVLVPPGDPDALADALDEWLRSSTLRERWRRAAGRRRGALPGWASTARSVAVALQVAAEPPLASIRRPG